MQRKFSSGEVCWIWKSSWSSHNSTGFATRVSFCYHIEVLTSVLHWFMFQLCFICWYLKSEIKSSFDQCWTMLWSYFIFESSCRRWNHLKSKTARTTFDNRAVYTVHGHTPQNWFYVDRRSLTNVLENVKVRTLFLQRWHRWNLESKPVSSVRPNQTKPVSDRLWSDRLVSDAGFSQPSRLG